jgi:hypothetical protein
MARPGRGYQARAFINSRALAPPVNTVAPVLSTTGPTSPHNGYPGDVLSMTTGTWTDSPSAFRYEWRWSDVPQAITGATSATYTLSALDVGHSVTGRVYASNLSGESAFAVALFSDTEASTTVAAPRVAAVSGGGGATLTGRKGTASATAASGGGQLSGPIRKAAAGLVTASGGGALATVSAGNSVSAAFASAGGNLATTGRKQTTVTTQTSAGGTIAASGALTPQTGGILATGLFGGGGRVGRSHPVIGVMSRGQVPMGAANPEARSGTVAGTGGGSLAPSARKGGISTTQAQGFLPPFVDVLTGARMSGGGSLAVTYSRTQAKVGIATLTGGGLIAATARKSAAGTTTATGTGSLTLTGAKGGRGATTSTGAGSMTVVYVVGESRSYSVAMSGGGNLRTTANKTAVLSLAAVGGGTLTLRLARASTRAVTVVGGGSITTTATAGGANIPGSVSATGSGRLLTIARKGAAGAVPIMAGGGSVTATTGRAAAGTVRVTGGGRVLTVRLTGSFAPAPRPRISRSRRGRVRLTGVR